MASYNLTRTVTGHNINSVRKLHPGFQVAKVVVAKSRADRWAEAQAELEQGKSIAEELRDELREWLDGLPDNLQNGDKAGELDEAIGALDEVVDLEIPDVDFPGMY